MTRTLPALAALALLLSPTLAACSGNQSGDSNPDNQVEQPVPAESAPAS